MPPLDPEIPGFCPWGPWGTYFDDLELIIDPQERILGHIISFFMMEVSVSGCVYAYTRMHVCIYIYIYTYMHICVYAYIHICIYTHIHIYIYAYIHIYIYIHTWTPRFQDSAPPLEKTDVAYHLLIQIVISGPGRPQAQIPGSGHPPPLALDP